MTKQKGYEYLKGLVELSQQFDKQNLKIYMIDYKKRVGNCDYCNASLRYKIFFDDGATKIGIGVCCAKKLSKYLNISEDLVKSALNYFKKYIELCRRLKEDPKAQIALKNLEQEVMRLKEKQRQLREKRKLQMQQRVEQYSDVVSYLLKRRFWLSDWEYDFITNCANYITEKMEKILLRIYDEIKALNITESEIKTQEQAHAKLEVIIKYGKYKIWSKLYNIFLDIYNKYYYRELTPKQIALIDKWFNKLKQNQQKPQQRISILP